MNNQLSGAAFHEAGHAIVARFFGLGIGAIEIGIDGDDAKGKTDISSADHLTLVDRVAIWAAGIAAQRLFKQPTHELAGLDDLARIHELLEDELNAETDRDACYDAGFKRAREILASRREAVERLAHSLIEHRKIDGTKAFGSMT